MVKSSVFTLDSLPWSAENLRQSYFRDFAATRKAIQEHPGYVAHQILNTLHLSLNIYLDSVAELMHSIDAFCMDAQSPEFWARPARRRFESRELAIRRGVFTVVTSAMALVDHARVAKTRMKITDADCQMQLRKIFDENEHRFIQVLRNYIVHSCMTDVDWQRTFSASGKETRFLLRREILLKWDGWDKRARDFINKFPQGIDIDALFNSYRTRVIKYHDWLHGEVARVSEPMLSEYREYERMLNGFETQSWWNLLLEQVLTRHLDPFTYLDRYLTKEELAEVLTLPRRSCDQIERIIEILDEYGSCDEKLRKKVYLAFGIDMPNQEA